MISCREKGDSLGLFKVSGNNLRPDSLLLESLCSESWTLGAGLWLLMHHLGLCTMQSLVLFLLICHDFLQ